MRRPKLDKLDEQLRKWLERELVARNFSDYTELTEALNAKLQDYGFTVSRSALHSMGVKIQKRLQSLRDATESAKLIALEAQDLGDDLSGAVIGMLKTEMFNVLLDLKDLEGEDDPVKRSGIVAGLSKAVAELAKASIAQKKYAAAVSDKIEAKLKALEAQAQSQAGKGKKGLDAATLARVRQEFYGIA